MANLQASLSGTLTIGPAPSSPPAANQSTGGTFGIGIVNSTNAAPAGEISQAQGKVSSPAAYVAQPFPANLTARLFYFRAISGGPFDIRLTHATSGQVVYAQRLSMLTELDQAEQFTAFDVQGEGEFEWAATGPLT